MKTYFEFIKNVRQNVESAKLVKTGKSAAFGGKRLSDFVKTDLDERKRLAAKLSKIGLKPTVLIFAPHPDDECMNSLPLRFMTECGFDVIDAAVTLGSNRARQKPRKAELADACDFLGWGMSVFGFERIAKKTRSGEPEYWAECVGKVAALIERKKPAVVFAPHPRDWNKSHIGTSLLVSDALKTLSWSGVYIQTELWQAMENPNLLSEVSPEILAAMTGALSCHTKEVERNPYHLNLVSYFTDNVRRGAEIVGGQGGDAPKFAFGQNYRVLARRGAAWRPAFASKILTAEESVSTLLEQLWK